MRTLLAVLLVALLAFAFAQEQSAGEDIHGALAGTRPNKPSSQPPTGPNDYFSNVVVTDPNNSEKPQAESIETTAAPLTQEQLVEKLRNARAQMDRDAKAKKILVGMAQKDFTKAKQTCRNLAGKYNKIAKGIKSKVQKAKNTLNADKALAKGKKDIAALKLKFKKAMANCKKNAIVKKDDVARALEVNQNAETILRLNQLRAIAQKHIAAEHKKAKNAESKRHKKNTLEFKKAIAAAHKGKKHILKNFIHKAKVNAQKDIHTVLKNTQDAAQNTDVFTAKQMFINARKRVAGIKKNFNAMKNKAKNVITKVNASGKFGRSVVVADKIKAKRAHDTIVLAVARGDLELLKKGRKLARESHKVVVKKTEKSDKKDTKSTTDVAKKAAAAKAKVAKLVKSGRTKCRTLKQFKAFKKTLAKARKHANTLAVKARKCNKL